MIVCDLLGHFKFSTMPLLFESCSTLCQINKSMQLVVGFKHGMFQIVSHVHSHVVLYLITQNMCQFFQFLIHCLSILLCLIQCLSFLPCVIQSFAILYPALKDEHAESYSPLVDVVTGEQSSYIFPDLNRNRLSPFALQMDSV